MYADFLNTKKNGRSRIYKTFLKNKVAILGGWGENCSTRQ